MIAHLTGALRRTARLATDQPRASLWTLLVLTCAMVAVGIAAIAVDNVTRWSDDTRTNGRGAGMVVYLADDATDARAGELVTQLHAIRGVDRVELIGSAETGRRLAAALGTTSAGGAANRDDALFAGLDTQGLPASIEVAFAPGVRDVLALSPTVKSLKLQPGVVEVVVEEDREPARVAAGSLATIRAITWAGAGVFGGLALLVVLATIRVRLDRNVRGRQETAVAYLLGAEPSFFAIPTALAGALYGAVGALVATGVLLAGLHRYAEAIAAQLAPTLGAIDVAFPARSEVAIFVGGMALLGLLGGALAGAGAATERELPRVARAFA